MQLRDSYDVIVVGGGMAGMVAATTVSTEELSVCLLEKGSRLGGSMYLSGGNIWTYNSAEEVRENIPDGNAVLQRLIVDSIEDEWQWLEAQGIEFTETIEYNGEYSSTGKVMDPKQFTNTMRSTCEENGCDIFLNSPMSGLRTNEKGEIKGVTATRDGEQITVDCNAVLIATGGFQGNEELVGKYITPNTDNLRLRSNPWSTGDGLEAARAVGAKLTVGLDKFYGHSLCGPSAEIPPTRFTDASQFYGPRTVALDRNGNRFTDEAEAKPLEGPLALDIVKEAGGVAYLVLDDEIAEASDSTSRSRKNATTIAEAVDEFGGSVVRADSLTELGEKLSSWEVNADQVITTLTTFNEAMETGTELTPPRSDFRYPLDTPPFYAVAVEPGITFTMGGLDVDVNMRVLRRSASMSGLDDGYIPESSSAVSRTTIEGLYAAGVDVGNVHHRHYMGGLAHALVTGRKAGRSIVNYVTAG